MAADTAFSVAARARAAFCSSLMASGVPLGTAGRLPRLTLASGLSMGPSRRRASWLTAVGDGSEVATGSWATATPRGLTEFLELMTLRLHPGSDSSRTRSVRTISIGLMGRGYVGGS